MEITRNEKKEPKNIEHERRQGKARQRNSKGPLSRGESNSDDLTHIIRLQHFADLLRPAIRMLDLSLQIPTTGPSLVI